MPDRNLLSISGAKADANAAQELLALSTLHLFQSGFAPNVTTPVADFAAAECDFAGYATVALNSWAEPILAGAAFVIYAPTQTFRWVAGGANEGNAVGGYYVLLADGTLYQYGTFDPARAAQGPDQAVVVTPSALFAAG
jgi:hypothetical protein